MDLDWFLRNSGKIIGLAFSFLAGVGALTLSIYGLIKRKRKLDGCVRVRGTVVGHVPSSVPDGDGLWSPKIQYVHPATGREQTCTTEVGLCWRRYRPGREVVLHVNPDDDEATPLLDSFLEKWFGLLLAFAFGVTFISITVAALLKHGVI
jgi:hypothetical protein